MLHTFFVRPSFDKFQAFVLNNASIIHFRFCSHHHHHHHVVVVVDMSEFKNMMLT